MCGCHQRFSEACSVTNLPFFLSRPTCFSRAADRVLYEEEEEVDKSGEQPELLEQRHHYGLFQQTRRGAAQRNTHSRERGTPH